MDHLIYNPEDLSGKETDPIYLKLLRVSLGDKELATTRYQVALRFGARCSQTPFYAEKAKKAGRVFWAAFASSYDSVDHPHPAMNPKFSIKEKDLLPVSTRH